MVSVFLCDVCVRVRSAETQKRPAFSLFVLFSTFDKHGSIATHTYHEHDDYFEDGIECVDFRFSHF